MQTITDDGIDHGQSRLEDCFEAVVERFEDGFVLCPLVWSGESCETCIKVWEAYHDKHES